MKKISYIFIMCLFLLNSKDLFSSNLNICFTDYLNEASSPNNDIAIFTQKWIQKFETELSLIPEDKKDEVFYSVIYELALLCSSIADYDKAMQYCAKTLPGTYKFPKNKRTLNAFLTSVQLAKHKYLMDYSKDPLKFDIGRHKLNEIIDSYIAAVKIVNVSPQNDFINKYSVLFEYAEFLKLCHQLKIFKDDYAIMSLYLDCANSINSVDDDYFTKILFPKIEQGLTGYGIEYLAGNIFDFCKDELECEKIYRSLISNERADQLLLSIAYIVSKNKFEDHAFMENFKKQLLTAPIYVNKIPDYMNICSLLFDHLLVSDSTLFYERVLNMFNENKDIQQTNFQPQKALVLFEKFNNKLKDIR